MFTQIKSIGKNMQVELNMETIQKRGGVKMEKGTKAAFISIAQ